MMEAKNLFELIKDTLEYLGDSWDTVTTIWLGNHGWHYSSEEGRKISKEEAERLFSADPPGSGYGGEECWNFHIYSRKYILFKGAYDGSEWVTYIPRNSREKRKPSAVGG